jgi:hypothetical protein
MPKNNKKKDQKDTKDPVKLKVLPIKTDHKLGTG